MIHDKSIIVGACDWEHEHWLGCFYPDDLPEDWRLSYYANEFSGVLLPQDKWCNDNADFEQWLEDVPEGFRFYLLSENLTLDDSHIKKELGDAFGGFVPVSGNAEIALIEFADKTLREWKEWIQASAVSAIFLKDKNLSVKQLADFKSLLELMGR